jgi:hypothetical protein
MENKEKQFISAVNVKQACVWMGVSRGITQISASNVVTFVVHIQDVQLIRYSIKNQNFCSSS